LFTSSTTLPAADRSKRSATAMTAGSSMPAGVSVAAERPLESCRARTALWARARHSILSLAMVHVPRRGLLTLTGLGAAPLRSGCASGDAGAGGGEEDVTPAEDLMREHGLLARILLVYEEGLRRLDAKQEPPLDALASAAGIVRTFVEDYH